MPPAAAGPSRLPASPSASGHSQGGTIGEDARRYPTGSVHGDALELQRAKPLLWVKL